MGFPEPDTSAALLCGIRRLHRYAVLLTRDEDDAQDLLQDTLLRAITVARTDDFECSVQGWLRRIMRNRHLDLRRKRSVEMRYLSTAALQTLDTGQGTLAGDRDMVLDSVMVRELREGVQSLIDALPLHYSLVVRMHYIAGCSIKEISGNTGLPLGTVRSRLARGRGMLRDSMKQLLSEDTTDA